jgi:hypothetical protein
MPGRNNSSQYLTYNLSDFPAGREAPATIIETKMSEDVSSTIAALEDERCAAMLSGDARKLDRLLDDRLRHVHSSGHVDNKASWMSNFGRLWQYRSIERQDQTIVPLCDSALVFNTLHIDVDVADVLRKVDARALTVWNKSGGAWRVVAVFLAVDTRRPSIGHQRGVTFTRSLSQTL